MSFMSKIKARFEIVALASVLDIRGTTVLVNPRRSDIRRLKEDQNFGDDIRGILDASGQVFIWGSPATSKKPIEHDLMRCTTTK